MSARLGARARLTAATVLLNLACGGVDPLGGDPAGKVVFTTWGEDYIEQAIPSEDFVDGWQVRFEHFLVNIGNVTLADAENSEVARMSGSKLFDNHVAGIKRVVEFPNLTTRAWPQVSYDIVPVTLETSLHESADPELAAMMSTAGYSVYVTGRAQKAEAEKRFAWGFAQSTRHSGCRVEREGRTETGVVVRSRAEEQVQLTMHGDHLFYDRLRDSSDPLRSTALRFEALASADSDRDGESTWVELDRAVLDVRTHDPSGLGAATHADFLRALVRTVGHFQGEGECQVEALQETM